MILLNVLQIFAFIISRQQMEQKSSLRMFMLPFISFCASACFQISGLIKNLNDNNHEEGNDDSVKIFCFIGVSLTSIRFGYCIATDCWDNPNYEGNPTYWMVEYLSITLNALTNVVNSNMFQITAFAFGVISIVWNLIHVLTFEQINISIGKIFQLIALVALVIVDIAICLIALAVCFLFYYGWILPDWSWQRQFYVILIGLGDYFLYRLISYCRKQFFN